MTNNDREALLARTFSDGLKALAAIVTLGGSDELEVLGAIPREPVMREVHRINEAMKELRALASAPAASCEVASSVTAGDISDELVAEVCHDLRTGPSADGWICAGVGADLIETLYTHPATTPPPKEGGEPIVVTTNSCDCHPETCCCPNYRVMQGDEVLMTGTNDQCYKVASLLIAASPAPPRAEGREVTGPMVAAAMVAYMHARGTYAGEVPMDADDMRAALTAALKVEGE